MSHAHSFAVDVACDCGLLLSEYTQGLAKSNAALVKVLKDTRLHIDVLTNATDSYCEFCRRHAPKNDAGKIIGAILHRKECFIGAIDAALATARGES